MYNLHDTFKDTLSFIMLFNGIRILRVWDMQERQPSP